jgi:hypothetical protein
MVLDNRLPPNIYTIVGGQANEIQANEIQANEVEDTNPPNVIENPPVPQFNLFLHFLEFEAPYLNSNGTYCTYSTDCPNCIDSTDGTHCLTMSDEYGNFDDDPLEKALEGAYDDYISAAGYWNDPFYDVRKQATRDFEKKQTKRQKRRAAKLTKKANAIAIQEKQNTATKYETPRPPKKSGRRGKHHWDDIVLV